MTASIISTNSVQALICLGWLPVTGHERAATAEVPQANIAASNVVNPASGEGPSPGMDAAAVRAGGGREGGEAATSVGVFELVDRSGASLGVDGADRPRPPPLSADEWASFMNAEGKLAHLDRHTWLSKAGQRSSRAVEADWMDSMCWDCSLHDLAHNGFQIACFLVSISRVEVTCFEVATQADSPGEGRRNTQSGVGGCRACSWGGGSSAAHLLWRSRARCTT